MNAWYLSADMAAEASWDETAPAGFEPVAAPNADGGDWNSAPAGGGFEAAAAPAVQYQQPDQFAAGY